MCSSVFFSWVLPLLRLSRSKQSVEISDLNDLAAAEQVEPLSAEFERIRAAHPHERLWVSLSRLVYCEAGTSFLCMVLYVASQVGNPLLIRQLVMAVSNASGDAAAYYALGLFGLSFVSGLSNAHQLHITMRMALRLRTVLVGAIFRRVMRVTPGTVRRIGDSVAHSAPVGSTPAPARADASTLLGADVGRFQTSLPLLHNAWSAPVLIVVSTCTFRGRSVI